MIEQSPGNGELSGPANGYYQHLRVRLALVEVMPGFDIHPQPPKGISESDCEKISALLPKGEWTIKTAKGVGISGTEFPYGIRIFRDPPHRV